MYKLIYSQSSLEDLQRIDITKAELILNKLDMFTEDKQLWSHSKRIVGLKGIFRLRVSEYRILFQKDQNNIQNLHILRIMHRKDIYKMLNKR